MRIRFKTLAGEMIDVDTQGGTTLMEVAAKASVRGILGDCGGGCSCGTCHVHLPEAIATRLSESQPPSELEIEILENSDNYCAMRSRLGCQVTVTHELDGILVDVPSE